MLPRNHIISTLIILIVAGLIIGSSLIVKANTTPSAAKQSTAGGGDICLSCHGMSTPGIVQQFSKSSMSAAGIKCATCHEVAADYGGAIEHNGTYIIVSPTPAVCGKCHSTQVAQYNMSRHATPAYAAMVGTAEFNEEQMAMYQAIPEGGYAPDKSRNALYGLEGPAIAQFACHGCHDIGKPNLDGSIGRCQSCHVRHEFSIEQARKPETCNACHIGPDHPQWEIYEESSHGIMYNTMGHTWNWNTDREMQDSTDFPAPQCATCHISGFGGAEATHDVGDRLSWYLFAPVSEHRPMWEENRARMQTVCGECHSDAWINEFYADADLAVEQVNTWVVESNAIVQPLKDAGIMTDAPFDQSIDFVYFDLWHHWGRTAKFGVWMQGADYVQWHGAYEILRDLTELREMVDEEMGEGE